MQDFFTQFCGRTLDPLQADFFYLPIVRDVSACLHPCAATRSVRIVGVVM